MGSSLMISSNRGGLSVNGIGALKSELEALTLEREACESCQIALACLGKGPPLS